MIVTLRNIAGLAVFALTCAVATAQPFNYLTQTRLVATFAQGEDGGYEEDDASAPNFGPFNVTLTMIADSTTSVASQNSTLGPSSISASGHVQATLGVLEDPAGAFAESSLNVKFQLMSPQLVNLTGQIFHSGPADPVRFSLVGQNTGTVLNSGPISNSTFPLGFAGMLPADTYTIMASSSYEFYELPSAHVGYAFELSVVPEPASALLLAAGAFVVGRRRRR